MAVSHARWACAHLGFRPPLPLFSHPPPFCLTLYLVNLYLQLVHTGPARAELSERALKILATVYTNINPTKHTINLCTVSFLCRSTLSLSPSATRDIKKLYKTLSNSCCETMSGERAGREFRSLAKRVRLYEKESSNT